MKQHNTAQEFAEAKKECRDLFEKKLFDYGTSWRIMRPMSLTDQIMIKAMRIRSIEEKGVTLVDEGIRPEFIGIVNYSVMALIQLELGPGENLEPSACLALYDEKLNSATRLMENKNHDYDEAWR
ncbi:MAG: DUF1599 domain-containing protein, partial [Muribaculaceae bacterium]|nr:DUF1599 domain-containing protein [Muribaculaceae bacterium]